MARTLFPQDIPSQRVTVMKDEASNSIILIGSRDNVSRLEEYVREMDVRGEDEDMQRMYVIPLKNSNVEDMGRKGFLELRLTPLQDWTGPMVILIGVTNLNGQFFPRGWPKEVARLTLETSQGARFPKPKRRKGILGRGLVN